MGTELSIDQILIDNSTKWRTQEETLLQQHQSKLSSLRESRKSKETTLSTLVLKRVHELAKLSLNSDVKQLVNLTNEGTESEQPSDKPKTSSVVKMDAYLEVANKLSGTKPGLFIGNLFESVASLPSGRSNIIHLHSVWTKGSYDNSFIGCLCVGNEESRDSESFKLDFGILCNGYIWANIGFCSTADSTKPLEKQFSDLMLAEKAIVISALFVATNNAVSEALQGYSKKD
jgi:hypothetical protein